LRTKRRFTYANLTATLALLVALSSGAYAVATLPRNSVGTRQLKDNSVKTKKVDNGTLLLKDIKKGQVDASNVKRWGPIHMNVDDPQRTLVTMPGLKLLGECTRNQNGTPLVTTDDEVSLHLEFAATIQNLSYRSYEEDGSIGDGDEDLDPGEGANWGSWTDAALVDGGRTVPMTFTATVAMPNGRGILSRHVMLANRGAADCTYMGRLDQI
jgi:hypothetical protein